MKRISKWLRIVATGSVSLMLAACDGTPAGLAHPDDELLDLRVLARTGVSGIPGIRVTFVTSDPDDVNPVKGTTGADGSLDFRYDPYQGSKLLLQDVDGVANGGEFADQNISFDTASSSVFVDLQLKP